MNLKNKFTFKDELKQNGKTVHLTKKELRLFKFLASKARTFTYEEIHKACWGDAKMSQHTLKNFVLTIRQKTYDDIILNRAKVGYEFNRSSK